MLDAGGSVIEGPRFPLLSALARVYLSVNSTSCQSERDFSILSTNLTKLRCQMSPDRVSKIMYVRLNAGRVKEVKYINAGLAKIGARQEDARRETIAAQTG